MKKIVIEKNESVAEVIDRILNEPDGEITLVIPKGSALGKTMRNFHLLKREIEDAGRTLIVESVDENILAFAKESGIEGSHPLWSGSQSRGGFSDILPEGGDEDGGLPADRKSLSAKKSSAKKGRKGEQSVKIMVREEEEIGEENEQWDSRKEKDGAAVVEEAEERDFYSNENRFFKETSVPDARDGEPEPRSGGIAKKIVGCVILGVLVLAAVFWGVPHFLGSVKVTLDFQKVPWEYKHVFIADKSVGTVDAVNDIIPAQVFVSNKNITQLFPATGKANVSQKAKGIITIYNAYSSAPQPLVATTRFATPDGKIFRLANGVTVPGAQVMDGQIVPSSIDATIVADQAGAAYNIGSVTKLTIPGLQGTAKYSGFYGSIASSTSGGFVGSKAVPTAGDIAAAKAKVTDILQSVFPSGAQANYPSNFKILGGATSTEITKLNVNTSTDQNGNFSVFGEAVFQAIGFDESALKAFLLTQAENGNASSAFSALNINYSGTEADFINGKVSFSLDAQGTIEAAFSSDDFKNSILGKSIADARGSIAALPGLVNGTVSAWPSWLSNIPSDPNKVQIIEN